MLKHNITFIFPYSLTPWDGARFGFDFLLSQGVHLKVLDLSALISTRNDKDRQFLNASIIHKIPSYAAFEKELINFAHNTVYIDCINGLTGFRWQSRRIFKLFKKYSVRYFIVEIGSLPIQTEARTQQTLNQFKKVLQIRKLMAYIKWRTGKKLADIQVKLLQQVQLPSKIFVGHTELLQSYLNHYRLSSEIVVPIHSFDYDRYLQYQTGLKEEHSLNDKPYCVFLDQALSNHSDFGKAVSFSPVSANKYAQSMQLFFDKIEKTTGLRVIVAGNPRSNYDNVKAVFGDRLFILNKTIELVAQSSLVLAHNSTAINFAVLFNKPILLIKTSEMLTSFGFCRLIDNMAKALNTKSICIDQDDNQHNVDHIDLSTYTNWPTDFTDYKNKYVKTQGIPNKITWQFVLDEISGNTNQIT